MISREGAKERLLSLWLRGFINRRLLECALPPFREVFDATAFPLCSSRRRIDGNGHSQMQFSAPSLEPRYPSLPTHRAKHQSSRISSQTISTFGSFLRAAIRA
jgi:hypothetical protein